MTFSNVYRALSNRFRAISNAYTQSDEMVQQRFRVAARSKAHAGKKIIFGSGKG